MTRQWVRRDHDAERAAIADAIERILSGVTADSQPPTVTDLAEAANLRRDYLYEHKDLLAQFKSGVAKKTGKSARLISVEKELREQKEKAKSLQSEIAQRDEEIRVLRLLLAETSLELDDLKTSVRRTEQAQGGGRVGLSAVPSAD
ncbi:hypothetical protein [uncultured Nocardioides sp.]|uniref:hypothetical protein n=1 Tax=uncultured Nocardioides sp. TaxID=198441 RepID=UPI00261AF855|nr:hypothetical protein [uncultured Nocardioides sp.]